MASETDKAGSSKLAQIAHYTASLEELKIAGFKYVYEHADEATQDPKGLISKATVALKVISFSATTVHYMEEDGFGRPAAMALAGIQTVVGTIVGDLVAAPTLELLAVPADVAFQLAFEKLVDNTVHYGPINSLGRVVGALAPLPPPFGVMAPYSPYYGWQHGGDAADRLVADAADAARNLAATLGSLIAGASQECPMPER